MISRLKKVVTQKGRSAGMAMAIITLEDLEGPIDATIFAENLAAIGEKHPGLIAPESVVMIKGKIDKRRETPASSLTKPFLSHRPRPGSLPVSCFDWSEAATELRQSAGLHPCSVPTPAASRFSPKFPGWTIVILYLNLPLTWV